MLKLSHRKCKKKKNQTTKINMSRALLNEVGSTQKQIHNVRRVTKILRENQRKKEILVKEKIRHLGG